MTDEKLNQILQQALTPEVQDEDIHIYKSVRQVMQLRHVQLWF